MAFVDERYLDGTALYGDSFSFDEIEKWYRDEEEAYADLVNDGTLYAYGYHALNKIALFAHLDGRSYTEVLGLGSAFGHELEPIAGRVGSFTIVEPSERFVVPSIAGKSAMYVKSEASGDMPFVGGRFDLAVALGVLHHIPNVSHVVREVHRVLAPGGVLVTREPIVSMGDWSQTRGGLTPRERGIPWPLFAQVIEESGFSITHRVFYGFGPLLRLRPGRSMYNSRVGTRADIVLAGLFRWNYRYHAVSLRSKLRPTAVALVATKS